MFNRKDYLTVKETAEILSYFPPYVSKLCREGKLEAVKRGRQYFIAKTAINKFLGIKEPREVDQLI